MTEAAVGYELMHIVYERYSGWNIANKVGWLSDLLNSAVPRRVITIRDEWGATSARIGRSIPEGYGEEDYRLGR